jgi:RNA polymerase sigma-54 factor
VIEQEDKTNPVTDDQLVEIMHESGYPIARRTVAKYREQMEIPVARLRRQMF